MRTPDVWPVIIAIAFVLSGGCSSGAGGKDDPEAGMADAGPGGADGGGDGGFVQPTKGPGKVLDFSAALDPAGLALEIDVDASATVPVRSVDSEVFLLEFTYRSQKLFGHQWEHDASLFVPRRLHPDLPPGAFAIIQLGTPNEQPGVSDTMSFRANYAGTVAAGLGIPVLVVPGVPGRVDLSAQSNWEGLAPAQCYVDGLPEDRYLSCLLRILAATGDLEADPFRYIAFSWMRTVTAAQRAVREARTVSWGDDAPIDLELEQAVILADGARAVGARMAAAVDPRVVGVFGGGADFADVENLLSSMESRWSSETGWFEELDSFRAFVDSADGRRWLDSVDPSRY